MSTKCSKCMIVLICLKQNPILFAVSEQNAIFIIDEKRIKLDSNTNQFTEGNNTNNNRYWMCSFF